MFCLVALGRVDEADQVVEDSCTSVPSTDLMPLTPRRASRRSSRRSGDASARLSSNGSTSRHARRWSGRTARRPSPQFEAMLRIADDPDIRTEATVAELKELGSGFLELSRAMPAPPKPVAEVAAAAARRRHGRTSLFRPR